MMDVYDISTMKKIYSLKAYSEVSVEKDQKVTIFDPSTENDDYEKLSKSFKGSKKNAVKTN